MVKLTFDDPLTIPSNVAFPYRIESIRVYTEELRNQCNYLTEMIPCLEINTPVPRSPSFLKCKSFSKCWIEVERETCTKTHYRLDGSKCFKKYVIRWKRGVLAYLDVHVYGFYTWLRHTIFDKEFLRKKNHEFVLKICLEIYDMPKDLWMEILEFL